MKKLVLIIGMAAGLNQTMQANFLDGTQFKDDLKKIKQEGKEQEAAAKIEKEKVHIFEKQFLKPVELAIQNAMKATTDPQFGKLSLKLQEILVERLRNFQGTVEKKILNSLE